MLSVTIFKISDCEQKTTVRLIKSFEHTKRLFLMFNDKPFEFRKNQVIELIFKTI